MLYKEQLLCLLYSETNKMHFFICVYSKIVLYMFRTVHPFETCRVQF